MILHDAVKYRIEKIETALQAYQQRYGMTWEQFEARGNSGELPDRFSYQIEKDYFDWDSLVVCQASFDGY